MVPYFFKAGHPQSQGWSPGLPPSQESSLTMPRTVTDHSHDAHHSITIPTRVSDPKYSQTPSQEWSPTIPKMVTYHPKDSYSPLQGWSPTIPRMGKPQCHNKPPSHPMDCHLPLPGGTPTIPQTVPYYPQDGHPLTQGQSSTILRIVIQHLRSPTFPWVLNH